MTITTRLSSRRVCETISFIASLLLTGTAHAALIPGFGLGDGVNINADELLVGYDSDTDTLLAIGINNVTLDLGGDAGITGLDGTGFRLKLNNPADEAVPSGTIDITGKIPDLGFESGVLLTGEITQFGWIETGDDSAYELQIVFTITGGDAAELFGPIGAIGFTQTDFPGLWTEDWINSGDGLSVTADYAPIPLPGALVLLGSSLIAIARRRTRLPR
jgi:hypothetical protein